MFGQTLTEESILREAVCLHQRAHGKLEIVSKVPLRHRHDLSLVYTPGVAEPCRQIAADPGRAFDLTVRGNLVAVVSDGSAVLGLGDVGPLAAMPVMEGKAILLKLLAAVDAVPLCLDARDVDRLVTVVQALAPSFGGINLEDIASPRCFEVEARLRASLDIPVFHDDQHGTAIVTAAALINALRVVGKTLESVRIVVNGAGAAGLAVSRLLLDLGAVDLILCDRHGALYPERPFGMNPYKRQLVARTNPAGLRGRLDDVLPGADVFIGLSQGGVVSPEMVRTMAPRAVVMAMANPTPEIAPADAAAAGAWVVCTGRSDFPNQINNLLAFPGVFRGALDVRAREINEAMKRAAVYAIADLVDPASLAPDHVIPDAEDPRVVPSVAAAVAAAAIATGVARRPVDPQWVRQETIRRVEEVRARMAGGFGAAAVPPPVLPDRPSHHGAALAWR